MEGVDWPPVLAHLADETAAPAHQAAVHVVRTQGHGPGQGAHQLTPVQLLQVTQRVQLRLIVQVLSTHKV